MGLCGGDWEPARRFAKLERAAGRYVTCAKGFLRLISAKVHFHRKIEAKSWKLTYNSSNELKTEPSGSVKDNPRMVSERIYGLNRTCLMAAARFAIAGRRLSICHLIIAGIRKNPASV